MIWQHIPRTSWHPANYCADGDGMIVVFETAGGYRLVDVNARRYVSRHTTLQDACAAGHALYAAEGYSELVAEHEQAYGAEQVIGYFTFDRHGQAEHCTRPA